MRYCDRGLAMCAEARCPPGGECRVMGRGVVVTASGRMVGERAVVFGRSGVELVQRPAVQLPPLHGGEALLDDLAGELVAVGEAPALRDEHSGVGRIRRPRPGRAPATAASRVASTTVPSVAAAAATS